MPTNPKSNIPRELQEAQGWNPEPGDVIEGKVVKLTTGWSDYTNGEYPIVTLDAENGEPLIAVHCFQAVLKNELVSAAPAIGETVAIAFHGVKPHRTDKKMTVAHYSVMVKNRDGEGADYWGGFGSVRSRGASAPVTPPSDGSDHPLDD